MSRFDEMRTFVRIVDAGSISRAAEQLGLAKSGVSRRLVELESRLGVRLLNRTTRRSSLTESGRRFYDGAVRLMADVTELESSVASRDAHLQGTLRVAAPLSFGLCHLSPALEQFSRDHEELTLDIDFSDRSVDLVEQGIDLAIRIGRLQDSSLKARRICPVRLVYCASPDYLEEHGTPRHPDELEDCRILQYDVGGGNQLPWRDKKGALKMVPTKPAIIANNGDFLMDMAVAGHGIVQTPTFISWQALLSGDLVTVLDEFEPEPLAAYAVYPHTKYLSRRARAFIDFLVERFGNRPYWDQFL